MTKQTNVKGGIGLVAMYHASLLELQEILDEQIVGAKGFYEARETVDVPMSDELMALATDKGEVLSR